MNYRCAIIDFCSFLRCATMWGGLYLIIVFPVWAETPTQRFLTNQATVTYTTSDKEIVTSSNESVVPITSRAEIALKSSMLNGLSPEIISLLLIESRVQRFLMNQATVTYTISEKATVTSSNESVVPITSLAGIKLKTRNPPKPEVLSKGVSPNL